MLLIIVCIIKLFIQITKLYNKIMPIKLLNYNRCQIITVIPFKRRL